MDLTSYALSHYLFGSSVGIILIIVFSFIHASVHKYLCGAFAHGALELTNK